MTRIANLFDAIGEASVGEQVDPIVTAGKVRIERIVSHGEANAPDEWYDQDETEWVLVLSGAAGLVFEDEARERVLRRGDHVLIAPHRRHRVAWTDAKEATIWLAMFWRV
jgi:cupin 2 domain-containing protein